ncbi:MAG: rhamnulokinase [Propionivibrio sp.]
MIRYVAAIDVGASSGRVILAGFDAAARKLELEEIHRFENRPVQRDGHDCWDFEQILREIEHGLARIEERDVAIESIGVDTWAVDFVLLDAAGQQLGLTVAYRDHRTDRVMEQVWAKIPRAEIYARTGIQFLQFNTLYQLQALVDENPPWISQVDKLLLVPDYLHYRLCGQMSCEYTNATATQLLNIDTGQWDQKLLDCVGVPASWFLPPVQAGTVVGHWTSPQGRAVKVIAPATHDTGSAVAAAPLANARTAYISSGTWSLMGLESRTPLNPPQALAFNITNEGGVEGTFRVLKNIMGLWLIQGVRNELGNCSFADLVEAAKLAPAGAFLIDPNDSSFLNPPSMIAAIRSFCERSGQGTPSAPGQLARCVFESLALLYKQTMLELEQVAGLKIELIRIVGGGSNNAFLNQLTADFCEVPVATGPVEASALGNVCYQLKGLGLLENLDDVRQLIGEEFGTGSCQPGPNTSIQTLWPRFQRICRGASLSS